MTPRAKVLIAVALTAILCLGVPSWWRKLDIHFIPISLSTLPTLRTNASPPLAEAEFHTVYWIGGLIQTNYLPNTTTAPGTNIIQVGFMDNGTLVWRPK